MRKMKTNIIILVLVLELKELTTDLNCKLIKTDRINYNYGLFQIQI